MNSGYSAILRTIFSHCHTAEAKIASQLYFVSVKMTKVEIENDLTASKTGISKYELCFVGRANDQNAQLLHKRGISWCVRWICNKIHCKNRVTSVCQWLKMTNDERRKIEKPTTENRILTKFKTFL
jgi:hypothetical protein